MGKLTRLDILFKAPADHFASEESGDNDDGGEMHFSANLSHQCKLGASLVNSCHRYLTSTVINHEEWDDLAVRSYPISMLQLCTCEARATLQSTQQLTPLLEKALASISFPFVLVSAPSLAQPLLCPSSSPLHSPLLCPKTDHNTIPLFTTRRIENIIHSINIPFSHRIN